MYYIFRLHFQMTFFVLTFFNITSCFLFSIFSFSFYNFFQLSLLVSTFAEKTALSCIKAEPVEKLNIRNI